MKRLLLVAYFAPPQPKAGALRVAYLARHLGDFGWEPTILTREYPQDGSLTAPVVQVCEFAYRPYGDGSDAKAAPTAQAAPSPRHPVVHFLRELAKSVAFFPDPVIGWYIPAARAGARLHATSPFDAVMSTSPPWTSLFVGRSIARAAGVPWIADYRDLWAGPPGPYFRDSGPTRLRLEYALERRVIRASSAVTTPAKSMGDALAAHFSHLQIRVIPNACDLAIWDAIPDVAPIGFRICYAGKLYAQLRTPDVVFAAIAKMRRNGDPAGLDARFDFYGEDPDIVAGAAARHGLDDVVYFHGMVDRNTALRAQRSSAVLLLLLNTAGQTDVIEQANPGSKIFEYAGARRPVLAVGAPGNAAADMMRDMGIGLFASDEDGIIRSVREMHANWRTGRIEPRLNPDWHPYTPRDLARDFAGLFDEVLERRAVGARRQ